MVDIVSLYILILVPNAKTPETKAEQTTHATRAAHNNHPPPALTLINPASAPSTPTVSLNEMSDLSAVCALFLPSDLAVTSRHPNMPNPGHGRATPFDGVHYPEFVAPLDSPLPLCGPVR